ncbi:MAG: protein kinase domain-containing protein [Chitinispirillaceae bacterium]
MGLFRRKNKPTTTDCCGDTKARIERLLDTLKNRRRYINLSFIGEGGSARVTRCFDVCLNRMVAVKELKDESLRDYYLVRAFLTEARLIGYLDHPGVVPVYDTSLRDDGTPCYTMKLIEGQSLANLLYAPYCAGLPLIDLPETRYLGIFDKLCETLAYVHDRGVIHLDLKPDNIMIGHYGEVMIMDWGNARLYDHGPFLRSVHRIENFTDKTLLSEELPEGVVLGTPNYMSPEQTHLNRDQLRPSSDIFSLGIIFYEMLTGRHPFSTGEPRMVMRQIKQYYPPSPDEVNRDIPRRLAQICMKMLHKDINRRYISFHEVLRDIDACNSSGQTFSTCTIKPGETICREGESGDHSFTILRGRVEVSKLVDGRKKVLAQLGAGEVVGELAVFTRRPRTATVTALEPTIIRIMHRADVDAELEKLSPWVGRMIHTLSERFIQLNDKMARQQEQ